MAYLEGMPTVKKILACEQGAIAALLTGAGQGLLFLHIDVLLSNGINGAEVQNLVIAKPGNNFLVLTNSSLDESSLLRHTMQLLRIPCI